MLLDRRLESPVRQILGMEQIGQGTDFLECRVDRRVDIIAKPLDAARVIEASADTHHTKTGGNQLLACRIMKLRCDPLVDVLADGHQADVPVKESSLFSHTVEPLLVE